jgi:hypothetical protein
VSVTDGDRRYIARFGGADDEELFDHGSDPSEQRNLIEEDGADPADLRELAAAYMESGGEPPWGTQAGEVELDEMRLNHLRALGYVIKP